jgi:hypothetical protein
LLRRCGFGTVCGGRDDGSLELVSFGDFELVGIEFSLAQNILDCAEIEPSVLRHLAVYIGSVFSGRRRACALGSTSAERRIDPRREIVVESDAGRAAMHRDSGRRPRNRFRSRRLLFLREPALLLPLIFLTFYYAVAFEVGLL